MSNDKLAEALRDSTFVAAMLDAICETDGTVDRMKARDAACRVREALQSHAAEAAHEGSLLTGTTPDGKHYGLRGSKESVDTVSDMLIIAEVAQAQSQSSEWVIVPREPTEWMLQAAEDAVNAAAHCESTTDDLSAIAYKAALAAAPQAQARIPAVTDPLIGWREDEPERYGYAQGWNACCDAMLAASPQPQPAQDVDAMVARFLAWRLPENFSPDCGISFTPEYNVEYMAKQGKPPMRHEPVGTNLFDADQARAMILHILGDNSTEPPQPAQDAKESGR